MAAVPRRTPEDQIPPSSTPLLHDWFWHRNAWHCRLCMRRSRGDPAVQIVPGDPADPAVSTLFGTALPPAGACPGENRRLKSVLANPQGHSLHVTSYPQEVIIICLKCVCLTEGKSVVDLAKVCNKGHGSAHTRSNLNRMRNLQHPSQKRYDSSRILEPLVPVADLFQIDPDSGS